MTNYPFCDKSDEIFGWNSKRIKSKIIKNHTRSEFLDIMQEFSEFPSTQDTYYDDDSSSTDFNLSDNNELGDKKGFEEYSKKDSAYETIKFINSEDPIAVLESRKCIFQRFFSSFVGII